MFSQHVKIPIAATNITGYSLVPKTMFPSHIIEAQLITSGVIPDHLPPIFHYAYEFGIVMLSNQNGTYNQPVMFRISLGAKQIDVRSEERRVGKECRYLW